jgi:hypothetical protein
VSRTEFADGSSMTRHTSFSRFGCAAYVSLPNQPQDESPPGPCAPTALDPGTTGASEPSSTTG